MADQTTLTRGGNLFRLPLEIRQEIYRYALAGDFFVTLKPWNNSPDRIRQECPFIFLLSREIHQEVTDTQYYHSRFVYDFSFYNDFLSMYNIYDVRTQKRLDLLYSEPCHIMKYKPTSQLATKVKSRNVADVVFNISVGLSAYLALRCNVEDYEGGLWKPLLGGLAGDSVRRAKCVINIPTGACSVDDLPEACLLLLNTPIGAILRKWSSFKQLYIHMYGSLSPLARTREIVEAHQIIAHGVNLIDRIREQYKPTLGRSKVSYTMPSRPCDRFLASIKFHLPETECADTVVSGRPGNFMGHLTQQETDRWLAERQARQTFRYMSVLKANFL